MKEKIEELGKCFSEINTFSKAVIKYGLMLIFAVYFSAMCCAAFAGRGADYFSCMFYFRELTQLGKECFGIFLVIPMFLEIFLRARNFDRAK